MAENHKNNIRIDLRDLNPLIDTIHDMGYKSDYNFKILSQVLTKLTYCPVEIGPNEPEDKTALWIDTKDETVEPSAQNTTIISELLGIIASMQDRITSLENAVQSGGGITGDDDVTENMLTLEDGSPLITELGVPFILEN